jgi:hypothetical protein
MTTTTIATAGSGETWKTGPSGWFTCTGCGGRKMDPSGGNAQTVDGTQILCRDCNHERISRAADALPAGTYGIAVNGEVAAAARHTPAVPHPFAPNGADRTHCGQKGCGRLQDAPIHEPVTCTARDLMRMPEAGAYRWFVPNVGGNTVFLLPDGQTVATVLGWADHGWRAPYMNGQIELFVNLFGPAARLGNRPLLELAGARWVQGSHVAAPPWCAGPDYWKGSIAYSGPTELTLVQAMPHDCGAEPGHPCQVPWHRSVCKPPTLDPVLFRVNPDPAHRDPE